MFNLFRQKYATLYNGTKVKEGDKITLEDSHGNVVKGVISRRKYPCQLQSAPGHLPRFQEEAVKGFEKTLLKKGTLYLWNPSYLITDYITAQLA